MREAVLKKPIKAKRQCMYRAVERGRAGNFYRGPGLKGAQKSKSYLILAIFGPKRGGIFENVGPCV
jgi:hypothetical protein